MKTTNILKSMLMAVVCLGSISFASCSSDDDTPTVNLNFSKSKVSVAEGSTDAFTVSNGTQAFTAKSSNEKVATVKVDKNTITVTGVKEGSATVVVTDSKNLTGSVAVTVTAATTLKFSKDKAEVAAGKTADVTVSNGTEAFTAKSADEKVATVKVNKNTITVTGVKAGTTKITVTDSKKLTGSFSVTVK